MANFCLYSFVFGVVFVIIPVVAHSLEQAFSLTDSDIALISAMNPATYLLGFVPTMLLIEKKGRRNGHVQDKSIRSKFQNVVIIYYTPTIVCSQCPGSKDSRLVFWQDIFEDR